MRDYEGFDEKVLWKLLEENFIVYENGFYCLFEEYWNEFVERLKGLSMIYFKLVLDCFYKNGYV